MSTVDPRRLDQTIPFASLFAPWAAEAQARVAVPPCVQESACGDLERSLVARLSQFGALAAFTTFREAPHPSYDDFVSGGPDRLVRDFPGFAHLAEVIVDHWVAATNELLERVHEDLGRLPGSLSSASGPALVVGLRPRLGDPHRGARHVAMVQRTDGPPVLLKPRSLAPESVFFATAAASPGLLADGAPWVLDHETHGWMEFVGQETVTDPAAYWTATGRMLALLQQTGTTDLHQSNVIATAAVLMPVDLECLFMPEVIGRDPNAAGVADRYLRDSALGTGLLPRALQHDGRVAVEWCGLTGTPGQMNGRFRDGWTGLGTNGIARQRVPLRTPASANLALDAAGLPVPLDLPRLLGGYRSELESAPTRPDPGIVHRGLRTRVVLRPTATYANVIATVLQPDVLTSTGSVAAALAAVPDLDPDLVEALGPGGADALVAAERAALARLDIPMVWAEGGDLILDDDTRLTGVAARSGTDRAGERHARWADRGWRRAEAALVGVALEGVGGPLPIEPIAAGSEGGAVGGDAVLDAVIALAESLAADAVDLEDRRIGWVDVVPQGRSGRLQAELAPPGLYHGAEGIAVFLAVLARATGEARWADLAMRSLPPAPQPGHALAWYSSGTAGWAWAASVVGEALDDASLIEAAGLVLAKTQSQDGSSVAEAIAAGQPLDLIGGWGGVLAAAASMARRDPAGPASELALSWARSMAEGVFERLSDPDRARPLTRLGMAHGTTGVTHALGAALDLGAQASAGTDGPVEAAFVELVRLEDLRIAERGGVAARLDQGTGKRVPSRSWCWGVAGHLVATAAPWFADRDRTASLTASYEVLAGGEHRLAHACCGLAGTLTAAVAARDRLGMVEANELVRSTTATIVAGVTGPGLRFHERSGFASPGLFRGRAGVGLALLRAHGADAPSPLDVG